jgi:hypothetical protein
LTALSRASLAVMSPVSSTVTSGCERPAASTAARMRSMSTKRVIWPATSTACPSADRCSRTFCSPRAARIAAAASRTAPWNASSSAVSVALWM